MQEPVPADVAKLGLRALKTIALSDGELHALEREFIRSVQVHHLQSDWLFDELEVISAVQLESANLPADLRRRFLHYGVLVAVADRQYPIGEVSVLSAFAAALGVDAETLEQLKEVAATHTQAMSGGPSSDELDAVMAALDAV